MTLSTSWTKLVAVWIFDCIVLRSALARASVRFRMLISLSRSVVMSSSMESWLAWLLHDMLFLVEFVHPLRARSCGLRGDGMVKALIRVFWSVWIWAICFKRFIACYPTVSC